MRPIHEEQGTEVPPRRWARPPCAHRPEVPPASPAARRPMKLALPENTRQNTSQGAVHPWPLRWANRNTFPAPRSQPANHCQTRLGLSLSTRLTEYLP